MVRQLIDDEEMKDFIVADEVKKKKRKRRRLKEDDSDDQDDSDFALEEEKEKPKKKGKSTKKKKTPVKKKKKKSEKKIKKEPAKKRKRPKSEKDESMEKIKLEPAKKKKKLANGKTKKIKKELKDEEVEEEEKQWKWWDLPSKQLEKLLNLGKNDDKWTTLVHNGPKMAPPYEPHNVPILYKGEPLKLEPEVEEVATMYAIMQRSEYYNNKVFVKNFMSDWRNVMPKGHILKKAKRDDLDFTQIYEYKINKKEREKQLKKEMTREQKKALKLKKAEEDEPYSFCYIDGRKEPLGNFKVEPPSLFRGRGDHPLRGKLKQRVRPEDITINVGPLKKAPPPPEGHQWGEIICNPKCLWLATWKDNVAGGCKYIQLNSKSSFKGLSDFKKFETARKLGYHQQKLVTQIRKAYNKEMKDKDSKVKQRAVATWILDHLAIRAGNEKNTEESADTVGCCSLRVEHVTLFEEEKEGGEREYRLKLAFLGKDSVPYENTVTIQKHIYKAIQSCMSGKDEKDPLFDQLSVSALNAHLKSIMDGLTAKVFRTYNASKTLCEELRRDEDTIIGKSIPEKIRYYNSANRQVAILCNHQRAISKNHDGSMKKAKKDLTIQRKYLKMLKVAKKEFSSKEFDVLLKPFDKINDERTKDYDKDVIAYEKALKKLEKNAKKAGQTVAVYRARHPEEVPEKPKKPTTLRLPKSENSIIRAIERQKKKVKTKEVQYKEKDDNKNFALNTSKINYLDPRITIAFAKRQGIPVTKFFNKTLMSKFPWAMDAVPEYQFCLKKKQIQALVKERKEREEALLKKEVKMEDD
mmetsp:Transcript_400/g.738  ORF Transcript_400/g.738 Transcript_400/m.738 type:complete len:806 (-) Transcript_400:23-2440(-)|eukprot:CAMPEP_0117423122 /NCGR_PEP_ID=MMETSP0758-20121206/3820_1 /TAXON_ID=63605 /ORGANISM="Percolomonas cosmopolitus, Strain AE-1 (ATCC 50343)" /LENGTH=805 /DNA_ID=CAMNT_0005206143 /DNA_START=50 /DNA_END=2467 /DNA_ORIENTATION=+